MVGEIRRYDGCDTMQESCDLVTTLADHNRAQRHKGNQYTQYDGCQAELVQVGIPSDRRLKEDVDSHQHRERADVEDAFYRPDPNLRRDRHLFLSCDQVRTDELAGAAQQRQPREPDEGRCDQARGSRVADRFQEHLPAESAQYIGDIDQSHGAGDLQRVNVARVAELGPIEGSPVPHLEVEQGAQDCHHDGGGQNTFLRHLPETPPSPKLNSQRLHVTPSVKVNDVEARVNARGCRVGSRFARIVPDFQWDVCCARTGGAACFAVAGRRAWTLLMVFAFVDVLRSA